MPCSKLRSWRTTLGENRNAIIAAGALRPFVALLSSDQPAVQEQAARASCSLAAGSQHTQEAIAAAGALPLLNVLLRSLQSDVQAEAAGALQNLAICHALRVGLKTIRNCSWQQALHLSWLLCRGQTSQLCKRKQQALYGLLPTAPSKTGMQALRQALFHCSLLC